MGAPSASTKHPSALRAVEEEADSPAAVVAGATRAVDRADMEEARAAMEEDVEEEGVATPVEEEDMAGSRAVATRVVAGTPAEEEKATRAVSREEGVEDGAGARAEEEGATREVSNSKPLLPFAAVESACGGDYQQQQNGGGYGGQQGGY